MDIISGKCVICLGNTFVFSGKHKQKFLDLLKEHYFDTNQINDNKFLLQFKEKRKEKSICICCAYVIESYVNLRNKFQDHNTKNNGKCSICRIGSNLTCGTDQLLKDANTLLKNVHSDNKVRRLTLLCLNCCFCIVSWNKIKNIISKYSQNTPKVNIRSKRKYSLDDSSIESSLEDINMVPIRRTRRMSVVSEKMKQFVATNGTIKQKRSADEKPRHKKPKLIVTVENQLTHLLTASEEIFSTDIYLSDSMKYRVESDDRMMHEIAYISCGSNDEIYSNKNSPKINKIAKSRKRSIYNGEDKEASLDNVSTTTDQVVRMTRKRSKMIKNISMNSSVIMISDSDSENADIQETVHATRRKTRKHVNHLRNREESSIYKTRNECIVCNRHFARKYKLKLHELEHEASFTPIVLIKNESICNNTENNVLNIDEENNDNKDQENSEEIQNKLNTLVKQVVDDALTQIENEIEKNIVNQVVDDTLSQLENKIQEDKENSVDKVSNSKENNDTIEVVNEKNSTNNNESNITEITNIECKEVSEDNISNTKDIDQSTVSIEGDKIHETLIKGNEKENKKLSESDSEINDGTSCFLVQSVIESVNEISIGQIENDDVIENTEENILAPNEVENIEVVCNKDDSIFEECSEISVHNGENDLNVDIKNNEQNEIETEEVIDKTLVLNTEREIDTEEISNNLETENESCNEDKPNDNESCNENKPNDNETVEEKASSKEVCTQQYKSNEIISTEENQSLSENNESTSQNTDITSNSCIIEEDSDMENLHVSPDSNSSPRKKNDLHDSSSSNINLCGNNDTQNNADKYEIENILQNLGA